MSLLILPMPKLETQGITIRPFETPDDTKVCIDLQKSVWGFSDLEVVPHRMFVVAFRTGGQVIGAFDGDRAVGFALAFMASRDGELYIHSHMTAVLPEYQNRGIGRELKLAQRDNALARGINLIEWTFDPLQLRNAYFNIARLGAVVREYLPDVYGRTSSPLHHGLPTDRLVAHWRIRELRVEQILSGRAPELKANAEVSVPRNILEICELDTATAKRLQSQIRRHFQELFKEGFAVTAFEVDEQNGRYLLQKI